MSRYSMRAEPQNLLDFLEQYTVPLLKELAGLIPPNIPTRKADIIAELHTYLTNPTNLRAIWQQLDELQQAAVAEVVHQSSPTFDSFGFQAKYGQKPDWGTWRRYSSSNKPSLLQLFFYGSVMPLDLKAELKAFVPPPRTIKISITETVPETVAHSYYHFDQETRQSSQRMVDVPIVQLATERAALQELNTVLRLIEAGKIRASNKTNRVTKTGAKAITQALYGGDYYPPDELLDSYDQTPIGPIKAFAWPLIMQSAGLAELAGPKLQLTPAGKKALTSPTPEKTIRTIWKKWQKSKLLDEFNRIHTIKGQTGKGKRSMTAVSTRRTAITQTLSECPVKAWLKFDEFSRYIKASGHTFKVSRDLWNLYIAERHYGSLGYEGYGGWNIVQARYMLAFLFEYAATMGLIDIAYIPPTGARPDYGSLWGTDDLDCLSRYDGLLYIRLNNLGAWCLGLTSQYTPPALEEAQILKVLPNLDIVATAPLPPGDQLYLEQFSSQTNENVWKLDRSKLLQALEAGQTIPDIEKFLRAKSGDALPNPVAVLLTETNERVTSLKHRGEAVLIEAKDAALAQLIVNDHKLRPLAIMIADEKYVVVPKDNEATFRRALRNLGYGVSR